MDGFLDRWRLHRACLDRRMSLREAAEIAGIRVLRLYVLSGGYLRPRPEELEALADALSVEPASLLRRR